MPSLSRRVFLAGLAALAFPPRRHRPHHPHAVYQAAYPAAY
jgi:hypothetical protein